MGHKLYWEDSPKNDESLTIENIKKHFPGAEIINEEDNI